MKRILSLLLTVLLCTVTMCFVSAEDTVPGGTWAVFPCTMSTLQETNTRMWKEWLPACKEYKLGGNYNLELYAPPEQNYAELWLPLEKV